MKNTNSPSQLSSEQVYCFYHLFFGLLQHTNEQHKLVKSMLEKNFHDGINHNDAGKIAHYMWAHPTIFDDYLDTAKLNKREIQIINDWKKYHLKNKFYLVKYLKNGGVFLSEEKDEKPYLVKGLASSFEEMWPMQALPFLVEIVLLPFEGSITTCGLYYMSRVVWGNNICREIRNDCNQAELIYGLIDSLPFTKIVNKEDKNIGQIKFYLQSIKNLELYKEDLEELINENPNLYLSTYFYHLGLLEAKIYKKEYRKLGIKNLHFAIYGKMLIAAHIEKQQVENTVKRMVNPKELDRIVFDKI